MSLRALNLAFFALVALINPAFQARADASVASTAELIYAEVAVNHARDGRQYLLARRGNAFLMRVQDLAALRVNVAGLRSEPIDGEDYIGVDKLNGARFAFDESRQQLALELPPELFAENQLVAEAPIVRPTASATAAFVNYDVSVEYSENRLRATGFIEMAVSGDWGFVGSTATVAAGGEQDGVRRLDTAYVRDFPGSMKRLTIGDTVTAAPDWGRQVRFGGVRFGTEFGLRPGFLTFPTPSFRDRAALPSQVELLVDNALRFSGEVQQGPFSIDQVPLVSGAGDVTMVVRDALGVERRVTSSYYVSPRLLRRGLDAWSIEAGAVRKHYAIRSFDYGEAFVAGSYRRGVSDWLTLDGRAEASADVRMMGGGGSLVVPRIGEFSAAGAVSSGKPGSGMLYRFGFTRISPRWSISACYQRASRNFSQLGIERDEERITRQIQAAGGLSFGRWGNLSASYSDLRYASGDRARYISASYSVQVGESGYLMAYATRTSTRGPAVGRYSETVFGASFTWAFGPRTSATVQADRHTRSAEYRRMAPVSQGFGYRFHASQGRYDRQLAALEWRAGFGTGSLEVARANGETAARFQANGGVMLAGGRAFISRRIDQGVALVEVPGQANVRIYQENREIARTDSKGRAIIADLRAYEENRLAIAPGDLPMDARMASDTLIVVPGYRGAALARFDVEHHRAATVVLVAPDGSFIRAGSSAVAEGGAEGAEGEESGQLFVGFDGELFLPDARAGMIIAVETREGRCRATIGIVPDEVLPRIGPLRCEAVGDTT